MIKLRADIDKNEFYEPSDGCEFDGFYITAAELEQREREAFEAGHKAKVRQEYNSALIKNGFVSAAGRYKDVDEAFNDYLKQRKES